MKILVLAGGISNEREVSLSSGTSITNALKKLGHKAAMLDLFFGIEDLKKLEDLYNDNNQLTEYKVSKKTPNILSLYKKRSSLSKSEIGPNVIEACKNCDIVFLALHGGIGENGKLQSLLDIYDIKYTGTDSISSSLAMHKAYSKIIFNNANLPCAKSFHLRKEDKILLPKEYNLNYPVVVKICSGGSSIGVFISNNDNEYYSYIKECFKLDNEILVEEYINGREFAIPVIASKVMPVIEIIPKNGWFDYEHKYQDNVTHEICPAQIDKNLALTMQESAKKSIELLGIKVYARSDFRVDENNNIYCIEVNTLPGMTNASLFPKSCMAKGISYEQLCEMIVLESLKKYK